MNNDMIIIMNNDLVVMLEQCQIKMVKLNKLDLNTRVLYNQDFKNL